MATSLRIVTGRNIVCAPLLMLLAACASGSQAEETAPPPEEAMATTQSELGLLPVRCDRITFPVSLSDAQPATYNVVGWLCGRGDIRHRPVQVLVHGITYSHLYWDFPYKPVQYSYVHALTAAGYATLALDRIGIGESDHPPALDVTVTSNAHVVHDIVQKVRSGTLVAPSFGRLDGSRVMLVGHSLGTAISMLEAATYHDVDGVILTGLLHNQGPGALDVTFIPAQLEPRFASLPPGYLTSAPGARSGFYYTPLADPAVIALDEATKETGTYGEGGDYALGPAATPQIDVPVLSVIGDLDRLACDDPSCSASGTQQREYQYYSPAAHLQTVSIPYSGHDLNLQKQAPVWYAIAAAWSIRYVGLDTRWPQPAP